MLDIESNGHLSLITDLENMWDWSLQVGYPVIPVSWADCRDMT